jgi:hypothetical protein
MGVSDTEKTTLQRQQEIQQSINHELNQSASKVK